MIKFKYVIGKSTNPYENLALESYLMEVVTEGSLFLWKTGTKRKRNDTDRA